MRWEQLLGYFCLVYHVGHITAPLESCPPRASCLVTLARTRVPKYTAYLRQRSVEDSEAVLAPCKKDYDCTECHSKVTRGGCPRSNTPQEALLLASRRNAKGFKGAHRADPSNS